jgi:hypothetical protein
MRSAGNLSPEWGYLAPAPSFARTARVVLVATAIGATAGAGVVLSLINRPTEPEKTPIAARAIVTSVRAAAVPSAASSARADAVAAPADTPPLAAPPVSKRDVAVRAPSETHARSRSHAAKLVPSQPSNGFAPSVGAAPASASAPAAAPADVSAVPKSDVAARPPAEPNASTANASAAPAQAPATAEPASIAAAAPATENPSIMAPETAPPKKAKKHAWKQNASPSVGSILRRLFAAQSGRSSYPNSASNRGL